MTITSTGYDGTVLEDDWAVMASLAGAKYAVADEASFKVTIGGIGDRAVTVAAGSAFGCGILDVNDASINKTSSSVSSGSRWDTVCLARNWSGTGGTSTVVVREGTASKALAAGVLTTPGTTDDQPLALIRCQNGQTDVQEVVDLRSTTGKIHTLATAAGLGIHVPRPGAWAFALDTGHLWHAEIVGVTPRWVNKSLPVWSNIGLGAAFAVQGGLTPRVSVVGGRVEQSGAVKLASGAYFLADTDYTLFTLPENLWPDRSFGKSVACSFSNAGTAARIIVSGAGAVTLNCSNDTLWAYIDASWYQKAAS